MRARISNAPLAGRTNGPNSVAPPIFPVQVFFFTLFAVAMSDTESSVIGSDGDNQSEWTESGEENPSGVFFVLHPYNVLRLLIFIRQ